MCGIVGMIGDLSYTDQKMFRDLLIVDQIRGMDSTGVLSVDMGINPTYDVNKSVGGYECFLADLEEQKKKEAPNIAEHMLSDTTLLKGKITFPNLLLGHNRKATAGAIDQDNAHPFDVGDVIGVHNGTLSWGSMKGFKNYHLSSDSRCLYGEFEHQTFEKIYSTVSGAMALVWYDKRNNTVNFIRNSERPLYGAVYDKKSKLIFASEEGMIRLVFNKHQTEREAKDLKIVPFETHKLYTFTYKNKTLTFRDKKLTPAPYETCGFWGGFRFEDTGWYPPHRSNVVSLPELSSKKDQGDKSKEKKATSSTPLLSSHSYLMDEGDFVGPQNTWITRTEWEDMVQGTTCGWCDTPVVHPNWNLRDNIHWFDKNTWICHECAEYPEVKSYLG